MSTPGIISTVDDTYSVVIQLHEPAGGATPNLSQTPVNSVGLPLNELETMHIYHSISNPIMHGFLIYNDINAIAGDFIANCNAMLTIDAGRFLDEYGPESLSPSFDGDNIFHHRFLVNGIEVLESRPGNDKIKISFISEYVFNFLNNVVYSTYGVTQDVSTLIKNIASSNYSGLTVRASNIQTSNKVEYISSCKDTVLDAIYYVLDRGFDVTDGLTFLVFDHIEDEFFIWNFNDDNFKTPPANDRRYTVMLKMKNAFLDMTKVETTAIQTKNFIENSEVFEHIKSFKKYRFDYDNNEWSTPDEVTKSKIKSELLQDFTQESNMFEKKIQDYPTGGKIPANTNYSIESQFDSVYSKLANNMRSIFIENNVMLPRAQGVLSRTPGDPLLVIADTSEENQATVNALVGNWVVLQVEHVFTSNSYENQLMLGRNSRLTSFENIEYETGGVF
jgi:hypothetical protein